MPLRTTSEEASARRSAEPGPEMTSAWRPSSGSAPVDSRATYSGSNSLAWRASVCASRPAERPTTSKRSGYRRTTSKAWRAILPGEPRIVSRRFIGVWGPFSYEQGNVVYRGGREQEAVHAVQDAAVAGEEGTQVLH